MSKFVSDYDFDPPELKDILIGTKNTGILEFKGGGTNTTMEHTYNAIIDTSIANQVYCKAINFKVRDFIDHKILTATGGRLRGYKKISLAEINVEVEISTRKGSAFENEWYLAKWTGIQPNRASMNFARKDLTWKPQYLVYRDAEGDHALNGLIKDNPEWEAAATEAVPSFKLQSVRKKDRTTDIVNNAFSFTRKVTSG